VERAVRAGLALSSAMGSLASPIGSPLHLRVGIASGLVVTDGAAHEPVAIGEAPDLAAQLQSIAPPDTIVIAASTRHLVRRLFGYHKVGCLTLEGLADPIPAWQVVGMAGPRVASEHCATEA